MCVGVFLAIGVQSTGAAPPSASWPLAGNDISNSRTQPLESKLSDNNVQKLAVKWTFHTHGDVSATPTVANGVVYFPDWGGYLNAVDANTGQLIWQQQISSYGIPGAFSRTSPAIYGNELIFGDNFASDQQDGAHVYAVDAQTGDLLWSQQVDSNHAAEVTANPVIADGRLIVGVSSNEESDAAFESGYPCCTFRGKVLALNPSNGDILWSQYTVPSNTGDPLSDSNSPCTGSILTGDSGPTGCGYSGGAVWDTPAVDLSTGMVFVGSGNNYTAPDTAVECEQNAQSDNTSDATCTPSSDYFDSVLALNLNDGSVVWGHKVEGWDAWNVACFFLPLGVTWCPSLYSPDYDFGGSGPNLITLPHTHQTLVGVGQKSGIYWAFDETTGATVWETLVGPGSALGGIEWGTAYDGKRIYVPIGNSFGTQYTLADGQTATAGSWAALDPATGAFAWQVSTPDGTSAAMGPASEANGVVYVGDMAFTGNNMYALNATTGDILWSFPASGSVVSAPAIANGVVYWGSGYSRFGAGSTTSGTFYAFSLNGQ